jgi:ATP-dependent DNA helicase RecG
MPKAFRIPKSESNSVEFKVTFEKEAIESLCAFANTHGGQVYIGINDKGTPIGVDLGKETLQQWSIR